LFAAARPALIKARIRDKDRQVVSAAVASSKRTRWATRHIISAYNPLLGHIIKDAESAMFSFKRILADGLGFGSHLCDTRRKVLSSRELIQFFFRQFSQTRQESKLRI
jgi:hypothetical protein